jgi:hypothetical protein
MSKLLQRLSDASKSGVYRSSRIDEILAATRGSSLHVVRVDLSGVAGKDALLAQMAKALAFPDWFGGNWDALEDCLSDLSWSNASGHVLLIEGAQGLLASDRKPLLDVLAAAAASWAGRKRPFFAVFLDGDPGLPPLYNDRR